MTGENQPGLDLAEHLKPQPARLLDDPFYGEFKVSGIWLPQTEYGKRTGFKVGWSYQYTMAGRFTITLPVKAGEMLVESEAFVESLRHESRHLTERLEQTAVACDRVWKLGL